MADKLASISQMFIYDRLSRRNSKGLTKQSFLLGCEAVLALGEDNISHYSNGHPEILVMANSKTILLFLLLQKRIPQNILCWVR